MVRAGELERAVMDALWDNADPLSVRDVLDRLAAGKRELAYTTVMTVLERLHHKELVLRELHGKAWVYRPAHTRAEHTAALMAQALAGSDDRSAALVNFAGELTADDIAALSTALADRRRRARLGGQDT